ncbi:seminal vesicle secretory protein 6-like [Mus caroli]|uniref:Seminal vesicle secretory protein 6-like n=1 Tax=Mus caroli TaxID=10089 RepID=A0A6P5PE98_MUSCR|nr:seminal vesicle secretory protein 6-like [Mus caroli]
MFSKGSAQSLQNAVSPGLLSLKETESFQDLNQNLIVNIRDLTSKLLVADEKFSQAIEEFSSASSEANSPKSIVHEEVYEEKKFKRNMVNGEAGEDRKKASAGEIERSYLRKKEKQRFAQEMGK